MATARNYTLEILCPTSRIYSGEANSLVAPGSDGSFGVLYDHAPMLASLAFGVLMIRTPEDKVRYFVLNDGFFEIRSNRAVILVDTCEAAEQINLDRARAARERAEKRLADHTADLDIDRARAALLRALIRLHAAKLIGKG